MNTRAPSIPEIVLDPYADTAAWQEALQACAAVYQRFYDTLGAAFPAQALQNYLEMATHHAREAQAPASDLADLIENWVGIPFADFQSALLDILDHTAGRSAEKALAAWCVAFSLHVDLPPESAVLLYREVEQHFKDSSTLTFWSLVEDLTFVIEDGIRNGLTLSEIEQSVLDNLSSRFDDGEDDREFLVVQAWHLGGLYVNQLLKVEVKSWITMSDNRVCDVCKRNEAYSPIIIDQVFKSGHLVPPAHPRCRCYLRYQGASREALLGLQD